MESAQESTPLDIAGAASEFVKMMEPQEQKKAEPAKDETPKEEAATPAEEGADAEPVEIDPEAEPEEPVTIMVDGKEVVVSKEELAEMYKSGLRQSDYTKKTMEVAEQRKTAQAEIQKARDERGAYAQKLQEQETVLRAALLSQEQTNWQQLIETDPVEYLKQQHLYQQRQAALYRAQQEMAQVNQLQQAEDKKHFSDYLETQQQELLAKLPEWKDESKSKADKEAIKSFLRDSGYPDDRISQITDHKDVLLARKAMLYDRMVEKARAASKKVENLPQRTQRAGVGDSPNVDKRGTAYQRLVKSGSINDAAAVFASIL